MEGCAEPGSGGRRYMQTYSFQRGERDGIAEPVVELHRAQGTKSENVTTILECAGAAPAVELSTRDSCSV